MAPHYSLRVNVLGTAGRGALQKRVNLWLNGVFTSVPGDLDSSFITRGSWVNRSWKAI